MSNETENLENIRNQIDVIDDKLHDLLMKRFALSEEVGQIKAEINMGMPLFALRPAREIAILKRLWNRHKGNMDKGILIRIWREIISASINMQTPMTVAVFMPERGAGNIELAKDYFGNYTAILPCLSTSLVLKELMQGEANVAILSLNDDKQTCWWYALSQEFKRTVSVFLKLPLIQNSIGQGYGRSVFALSKVPFEKTGEDRMLLVAETDGTLSLSTLDLVLKANGIATNAICDTYMPDMMHKAYLFEVEGYLSDNDEGLQKVIESEKGKVTRLRVIGGYPVPFV